MLYKRSQGRWKNVLSLLLIWCVDRAGAPAQAQLSGGAPEEGPPSLATWLLGGSRGGDCSNSTIAFQFWKQFFHFSLYVLFHTAVTILTVLHYHLPRTRSIFVSHEFWQSPENQGNRSYEYNTDTCEQTNKPTNQHTFDALSLVSIRYSPSPQP